MNILTITGVVVVLTILVGALLAAVFGFAGRVVTSAQTEQEQEKSSYNPALTRGHKIPVTADVETQLKRARLIAARQAAALPRWGNMKIQGRNAVTKAPSAFKGVAQDPLTAVKIAEFHTWQGVRTGPLAAQAVAAPGPVAAAPAPAAVKGPEDLVAGVDYAIIEITDAMSPEEVRKARIANSKARSAAAKALKEAGTAAATPAPGATAAVVAPRAAAPVVGAAREPVAGVDYVEIAITDAMSPDEVRKARIANSKARSAAMKAFKAAGGEVGGAAVTPEPAVAQPTAPPPSAPVAQVALNAPPAPNYIEITDAMSPDEVRKARIANSKLRSEYNKALKAAGIDPSTVA